MPTTMPSPESNLQPGSESGLSQLERVVDTFIAPSKAFHDIRRSASWWVPFLITCIVSIAFSISVQQKVGWPQVMENVMQQHPAMQAQMDKLPADQRAQRDRISIGAYRVISYSYPLMALIIGLIVAGVLMLTINLGVGGQATYGQYFATNMYAVWLPGAVKALLIVLLVWVGDSESFNLENPIGTNLGFYLTSAPAALRALLTSLDVFSIWSAILLAMGLSIVCKISRGAAYAVVFGWWGIIVLFGVARAAISG